MINIIKTALPSAIVEQKGKDIIVKSKEREQAKKDLEKFFTSKKVKYTSVFKASKSSSLDVLNVPDLGGDIIFKPIIQKGAGGISFEKELMVDIENFLNGAELKQLKNKETVSQLSELFKWYEGDLSKYEVVHEGSKNQKRALTFNGSSITISNNTGETLTDITIRNKKTNKKYYLSLKMSKSYYTLSASIGKYFADKTYQSKINEFFGFDGVKQIGFGSEFACVTKKPNYSKVTQNLENVLVQAVGSDMILVHKKTESDVVVKPIQKSSGVFIDKNITEACYTYPIKGVRKYANIKFNAVIGGYTYIVNFQFRGTTAADVGPKYLRILLERT